MITKDDWVLVYEDGREVNAGDEIQTKNSTYTVIGGRPPLHRASTGRVYTKDGREFFPSVLNLKWKLAGTKLERLHLNMMRYHTDEEVELVSELIAAAQCALADLQGSLKAYEDMALDTHDWQAHRTSIADLMGVLNEEQ